MNGIGWPVEDKPLMDGGLGWPVVADPADVAADRTEAPTPQLAGPPVQDAAPGGTSEPGDDRAAAEGAIWWAALHDDDPDAEPEVGASAPASLPADPRPSERAAPAASEWGGGLAPAPALIGQLHSGARPSAPAVGGPVAPDAVFHVEPSAGAFVPTRSPDDAADDGAAPSPDSLAAPSDAGGSQGTRPIAAEGDPLSAAPGEGSERSFSVDVTSHERLVGTEADGPTANERSARRGADPRTRMNEPSVSALSEAAASALFGGASTDVPGASPALSTGQGNVVVAGGLVDVIARPSSGTPEPGSPSREGSPSVVVDRAVAPADVERRPATFHVEPRPQDAHVERPARPTLSSVLNGPRTTEDAVVEGDGPDARGGVTVSEPGAAGSPVGGAGIDPAPPADSPRREAATPDADGPAGAPVGEAVAVPVPAGSTEPATPAATTDGATVAVVVAESGSEGSAAEPALPPWGTPDAGDARRTPGTQSQEASPPHAFHVEPESSATREAVSASATATSSGSDPEGDIERPASVAEAPDVDMTAGRAAADAGVSRETTASGSAVGGDRRVPQDAGDRSDEELPDLVDADETEPTAAGGSGAVEVVPRETAAQPFASAELPDLADADVDPALRDAGTAGPGTSGVSRGTAPGASGNTVPAPATDACNDPTAAGATEVVTDPSQRPREVGPTGQTSSPKAPAAEQPESMDGSAGMYERTDEPTDGQFGDASWTPGEQMGETAHTTPGISGPDVHTSYDEMERMTLARSLPSFDDSTPLAAEVAEDARRRITLSGRPFPKPPLTRILTVANQKGGVGKTTTTVNLAAALAQAGLNVLVLDIDPQGNASTALGIDHHSEIPSLYDVVVEGMPLRDVVQECPDVPNLWCAPATIDLAGAEIELVSLVARETRLQKALGAYLDERTGAGLPQIDYVFVDCPPSLSLLTVNAFVAAREVLIPIQCEYYALEGLSQLLKHVELIRGHLNPALHVSTILLTMYDGRTRLSAQVADEVRDHFPEQVVKTTVPRSVRISEAPSHGQTVMTYDPASSGALSYLEAARELAEQVLSWTDLTKKTEERV